MAPGKLTELLLSLRVALAKAAAMNASASRQALRFAYNQWLQDWEIWAVRGLVDELIVQNYAYSLKGFQNDLARAPFTAPKAGAFPCTSASSLALADAPHR